MRKNMRQTIKLTLNKSMMQRDCSICAEPFEVGASCYTPTCDPKHMAH